MRQQALNSVYNAAKVNPKIVFIGSDLGFGTLDQFKKDFPERFFMEGISEQHLIGFASGLAKQGYIPFINTIANFLTRRALEQIILDVALHNLPVKILASGGGMVYAPLGPTHTATDDLAHMLAVPNIGVFAPCDASEMEELIQAESNSNSPSYIRFGKGGEKVVSHLFQPTPNKSFKYYGNLDSNTAIISTGVTTQICIDAMNMVDVKDKPLLIHILKLNLNKNFELLNLLVKKKRIIVVEEHQRRGGLLTEILHFKMENSDLDFETIVFSLGDHFLRNYGSQIEHFENHGITAKKIAEKLIVT